MTTIGAYAKICRIAFDHNPYLLSAKPVNPLSFSVASYNVLASAYIKAAWYPRTAAAFLNPQVRIPTLIEHVAAFATDVICLQEVERDTLTALQAELSPLGYVAHYAMKSRGQPDGCAIFVRENSMSLSAVGTIKYADGDGMTDDSGHIALVIILHHAGRSLGIANTHLKWDPPKTPSDKRRGLRQIRQLLLERNEIGPDCHGWIICGDFNATPDSEVVAVVQHAGLAYTHQSIADGYTCNTNGTVKLVDYLFHSPELRAEPRALPILDDQTPLPSTEEPSDHLAVISQFYWVVK